MKKPEPGEFGNQIVVYQPNETMRLDVRLENNVFAEGEVGKESNVQILHIANSSLEGKVDFRLSQGLDAGMAVWDTQRRRGLSCCSAHSTVQREKFMNAERPASGRGEATGGVGFNAKTAKGRDAKTRKDLCRLDGNSLDGKAFATFASKSLRTLRWRRRTVRKECSPETRSASPATLSLHRKAALCLNEASRKARPH